MSPVIKPLAAQELATLSGMASEFLALRDALKAFQNENDPDAEGSIVEDIQNRMSNLARRIVDEPAKEPRELTLKAAVALDWINDDGDLSEALSASVCRDLIALFDQREASKRG